MYNRYTDKIEPFQVSLPKKKYLFGNCLEKFKQTSYNEMHSIEVKFKNTTFYHMLSFPSGCRIWTVILQILLSSRPGEEDSSWRREEMTYLTKRTWGLIRKEQNLNFLGFHQYFVNLKMLTRQRCFI